MSGFLFDLPVETQTREQGKPLTHRSDPKTSYEAAEQLQRSGRLHTSARRSWKPCASATGPHTPNWGPSWACTG